MNEDRVCGAAERKAIADREGTILRAYKDTKGVWTIGVGHTGRMSGRLVRPDDTCTPAQADQWLTEDIRPVETALRKVLRVPVTQNEWGALVSLYFNVGTGYLKNLTSSSVVRALNVGDVAGAGHAFLNYVRPPEIEKRRRGEMAQFLRPDATRPAVVLARANDLMVRADEAKETSTAAGAGSLGTVAAGAAGAAILLPAHPAAGAAAVGFGLVGGAGLAVLAWAKNKLHKLLEANAWAGH